MLIGGTGRSASNLEKFKDLEHLVLDNNELSEGQFPLLPKLHTLCVNNNKIEDLDTFVDNIKENLPSLKYLSMLKNPACPNFFSGKRDDDYTRYR